MKAWRVVLVLLAGLVVGLGLGFLLGWGVWPVQYYDTDPVDLRDEHKEDYIVLVSATYALNRDLAQAKDRLAKLEEADVAQVVADLAQSYLERGEDNISTRNLVMLADALGTSTEAMIAFVATATPTFTPTFTPTATEVPTETPTETPLPTATSTAVPPTATSTPLPPAATSTPAPPTSTSQPATSTAVPATQTPTSQPPTSTPNPPTATTRPVTGCPGRPGVTIRDIGAGVRGWGWLSATFGGVAIQETGNCPGGVVYAVDTLWEYHDVSLRATVLDGGGNRMPNVPVAFFGFGGTVETPGACRPNATVVYTNQDGEANMVMGWGSAYIPPAAGYHAVWVMDSAGSDCVTGLGMVDYTEHQHLNITFRLVSR